MQKKQVIIARISPKGKLQSNILSKWRFLLEVAIYDANYVSRIAIIHNHSYVIEIFNRGILFGSHRWGPCIDVISLSN